MIVVDDDGAVVIPQALVDFVARKARSTKSYEAWVVSEVEKRGCCPASIRRTTKHGSAMKLNGRRSSADRASLTS